MIPLFNRFEKLNIRGRYLEKWKNPTEKEKTKRKTKRIYMACRRAVQNFLNAGKKLTTFGKTAVRMEYLVAIAFVKKYADGEEKLKEIKIEGCGPLLSTS